MYYTVIENCPHCNYSNTRWIIPALVDENLEKNRKISCSNCYQIFDSSTTLYQILLTENCFSSNSTV